MISLVLLLAFLSNSPVQQTATRGMAGGASLTPDQWWKLNENTGTSAANAIGGKPALTLNSSSLWHAGKTGSGFAGDGATTAAQSASSITYGSSVITVCFWYETPNVWASGTDQFILEASANASAGSQNAYFIEVTSAGGLLAIIYDSAGGFRYEVITPPSTSAWHHYALVLDNSTNNKTITWYVDGSTVSQTPTVSGSASGNFTANVLNVLSRNQTTFWDGDWIDGIRIFNRGLSSSEVTSVFNDSAND